MYNVMFWYMYTLWNDYNNQTNVSITSHGYIFDGKNTWDLPFQQISTI